ncbi:MAG TPA: hypothetical protein VFH51_03330 [Myxococcota bacterium]|nr:hypothetical protein [Myxococcota bacterium]
MPVFDATVARVIRNKPARLTFSEGRLTQRIDGPQATTAVTMRAVGKPKLIGGDVFDGRSAEWGPALDRRFKIKEVPDLSLVPPLDVQKPLPPVPTHRSALDLPRVAGHSVSSSKSRSALDLTRAEVPPLPQPASAYERTRARIKETFEIGKMAPAARVFHALVHRRR